jgi:phi13 family phage major tail protein
VELAEATLWADDGAAEIIKEFKSGKLALGVDDIGRKAAEELTGASTDDNGVLVSASEDSGLPVAIGFRAKKANGKYRYFWLYKVKFAVPSDSLATKGDSITFQTPKIEGTVMRRNKLDGNGRHPWKAEVTEGDTGVEASIITGWYSQVYEPTFAATGG